MLNKYKILNLVNIKKIILILLLLLIRDIKFYYQNKRNNKLIVKILIINYKIYIININ